MPKVPDSTKSSLQQKLTARARQRWPQLTRVDVTHRTPYAYVTDTLTDGEQLPLCRMRYGGSASIWGFSIYRASHDDYQPSMLHAGNTAVDRAWFVAVGAGAGGADAVAEAVAVVAALLPVVAGVAVGALADARRSRRDWGRAMSSSGAWLATAVGVLPAGGGAEALLSPGLLEAAGRSGSS